MVYLSDFVVCCAILMSRYQFLQQVMGVFRKYYRLD